jgi:iron complex transport system substrate-binding protein
MTMRVPFAVLLFLLGLNGCREGAEAPGGARNSGAPAGMPRRIVCGSPAVAEIVFALGCGDRVVGVSAYTVYPPEAKKKESIGGYVNPNRERLLRMKPDLIISQGQHERLAAFADAYGIRFLAVKLDALKDIYAAVSSIAEALSVTRRGETLNADIRRALGVAGAAAAHAPPARVVLLFSRTPGSLSGLSAVGPGTFLDDIIRIAGGTNIFADAAGFYPQVSKESLLVRKPDVILEVNPGALDAKTIASLRADWQAFADLPAVRNGRIHTLTNDYVLIPGPRVGLIARDVIQAIAPEALRE